MGCSFGPMSSALLSPPAGVQVFAAADGRFLRSWGSQGSAPGQFQCPKGIAASADGSQVAVADWQNHRVQIFRSNGEFVRALGVGRPGNADGELESPLGVAYTAAGEVVVADTWNHRIQVFGPDGALRFKWGVRGDGAGQLSYPRCVLVTAAGELLVSDDYHRVQVFRLHDGALLGQWGSEGEAEGQWVGTYPSIALSTRGEVALADDMTCLVTIFR